MKTTLSALLVLMAPRDHGKTTIGVGYMLWRACGTTATR